MYKRLLWLLIAVTIAVLIYFAVTLFKDISPTVNEDADHANDPDITEENNNNDQNENENNDSDVYKNPFNQIYTKDQLTDEIIQDYIHKMSHQKIVADVKWGFYRITDDRISWLLDGIEQNQSQLNNKDIYEDILTRWNDGDFSRVDHDHNAVWNLQGGTIGKATGIMTEQQEEDYIKNTKETN